MPAYQDPPGLKANGVGQDHRAHLDLEATEASPDQQDLSEPPGCLVAPEHRVFQVSHRWDVFFYFFFRRLVLHTNQAMSQLPSSGL